MFGSNELIINKTTIIPKCDINGDTSKMIFYIGIPSLVIVFLLGVLLGFYIKVKIGKVKSDGNTSSAIQRNNHDIYYLPTTDLDDCDHVTVSRQYSNPEYFQTTSLSEPIYDNLAIVSKTNVDFIMNIQYECSEA